MAVLWLLVCGCFWLLLGYCVGGFDFGFGNCLFVGLAVFALLIVLFSLRLLCGLERFVSLIDLVWWLYSYFVVGLSVCVAGCWLDVDFVCWFA